MSSISIKWNHKGLFRRFGLPVPANGDLYGALMAKVTAVMPDFNDSLAWKDGEGDLIVFTSTTELTEAINTLKQDEPLRIFTVSDAPQAKAAKTTTDGKKTSEEKEKTLDGEQEHTNVVCDGCEGVVKGIRYKCLGCMDFDLCALCEKKGIHSQHPMQRIVDPTDRSWVPNHMMFMRRQCRNNGGPPGPRHWWRQHMRQHQQHHNQAHGGASGGAGGAAGGQPQPDPAAVFNNGMEFLHQVGNTVAEALSNLGIAVDVDVEHDGKREKAFDPKQNSEGTEQKKDKEGDKDTENKDNENKDKENKDKENKDKENKDKESKDKESNKETDTTEQAQPGEKTKETSETGRDESPGANGMGWTLLEKEAEGVAQQAAQQFISLVSGTAPQGVQSLYPNVTVHSNGPQTTTTSTSASAMTNSVHHSDPVINETLNQLMAMGFDNEGGWLQQLCEAKRGDINAVLNVFQPRQ